MTTLVCAVVNLMLVLNLASLGLTEVHTSHGQPINGTPVLVPVPKKVTLTYNVFLF